MAGHRKGFDVCAQRPAHGAGSLNRRLKHRRGAWLTLECVIYRHPSSTRTGFERTSAGLQAVPILSTSTTLLSVRSRTKW